jgi:hypothetical protein
MIKPARRAEKFDRWLLASVAFHAGIVVVFFVAPTLIGAKPAAWGTKAGGNGGVNLKLVTSLPGIALPAPPPNADEDVPGKNESIHKPEPEAKTKASEKSEPAELKLPSKTAPKKTDVAANTPTPGKVPEAPSNAVSYGQGGGAPALRYGQTGTGPTGAEIAGDGSFGEKYGWYVESMTRAISYEWKKDVGAPATSAEGICDIHHFARWTCQQSPTGSSQRSGQTVLDNAVLRAVRLQNFRHCRRTIEGRMFRSGFILTMRDNKTRREFAAALILAPMSSTVLRGQQIVAGTNVE